MFDHFVKKYGTLAQKSIYVPYGSRVYGTHSEKSDFDFICVSKISGEKTDWETGIEYSYNNINIHPFSRKDFQDQLKDHKIHAMEAYFHPDGQIKKDFQFELQLPVLRHELSKKASHSFVKAHKKIEIEKDYYTGWKSLFHSLRILNFGIQISNKGMIEDFTAANSYWFDILNDQKYNWAYFKEKYQPEYNRLGREFRSRAPKEIKEQS